MTEKRKFRTADIFAGPVVGRVAAGRDDFDRLLDDIRAQGNAFGWRPVDLDDGVSNADAEDAAGIKPRR